MDVRGLVTGATAAREREGKKNGVGVDPELSHSTSQQNGKPAARTERASHFTMGHLLPFERSNHMARFGMNLKLTIAEEHRPKVHAMFVEAIGTDAVQPMPGLEAYKTEDGGSVGVFFVAAKDALSEEDQRKGAWLEFRVDDVEATVKRLDAQGTERIDFSDEAHAYYRVPGGPVFRLARM